MLLCFLARPVLGSSRGLRQVSGCCLLFPGQGSQYVGMGRALLAAARSGSLPGVAELFRVAERVLGYDLGSLFLHGPQEKLDETIYCQPAVVVVSLAGFEKLKRDSPELLEYKAAAGFSVGEMTALIAAHSLPLEQGLHVVRARAEAMQRACSLTPSSMLSLVGLKEEAVTAILHSVKGSYPDSELCIGSYLFPHGFVVSGSNEPVQEVGRRAEISGAAVKRVRVSGAFHSKLMQPAVAEFEAVLKEMDFQDPVMPVYSNVTGLPYTSVDEIRTGLALQVTSPVLWSATISHMVTSQFRTTGGTKYLEIGPGKQLRGIMKRIDRTAYRMSESLTV